MQNKVALFGLVALIQNCYAHYTFPILIVNGTASPAWKYVRTVGPLKQYAAVPDIGRIFPVQDVTSTDIICNRDASSGLKTSIATVIAGDEVGFKVDYTDSIFHDGPATAYLSKAPNDDVANYDGKGDWFKIAYAGPSSDTAWKVTGKPQFTFQIPKTTPQGSYLLRMEHLYPATQPGTSDFFISCAQVNIVGPGGGSPKNFIRFPGGYQAKDPGIAISDAQAKNKDLLNYKPAGPPVWQG